MTNQLRHCKAMGVEAVMLKPITDMTEPETCRKYSLPLISPFRAQLEKKFYSGQGQ